MKLHWMHVKDKKPEEEKEVFVLFGEDKISYSEENPTINIGRWVSGRFLDADNQQLFSNYWHPIVCNCKSRNRHKCKSP